MNLNDISSLSKSQLDELASLCSKKNKKEYEDTSKELEDIKSDLSLKTSELSSVNLKLEPKRKSLESYQESINKLKPESESLKKDVENLEKEKSDLTSNIKGKEKKDKELDEILKEKENKIKQLDEDFDKQLDKKNKEYSELTEKKDKEIQQKDEKIKTKEKEIKNHVDTIGQLVNMSSALNISVDSLKQEENNIKGEIKIYKPILEKALDAYEKVDKKIKDAVNSEQLIKDSTKKLVEEKGRLQNEANEAKKKSIKATEELLGKMNGLEDIANLKSQIEGSKNSAKRILDIFGLGHHFPDIK